MADRADAPRVRTGESDHRPDEPPVPEDLPIEIRHLIRRLRSEDAAARRQAAEALGRVGAPAAKALPFLEARLEDEDLAVQVAAAEAMAKIRGQAPPGQSISAAALRIEDLRGTYRAGPPRRLDVVSFRTEVSATPAGATRAEAERYLRDALTGAIWSFRGEAVEVVLSETVPEEAGLRRLEGAIDRKEGVLNIGWLRTESGLPGAGAGLLGHQIQDVEFLDATDEGLTVRYTATLWMPRDERGERIEIRGTVTQALAREGRPPG